jgi:hypothetical protein
MIFKLMLILRYNDDKILEACMQHGIIPKALFNP